METFTPAPSSLVTSLASVPASVYDDVGVNSPTNPVTPLQPAGSGNAPLWLATADGGPPLPVVFFYGAEFAPYAAAERWPLILALSRFGTFTKLGLMQSSSTTAFANLSTFTFWNASYSSKYLIFVCGALQLAEPDRARYLDLQAPDAQQSTAIATYGSNPVTFALVDVANRDVLNGAALAGRPGGPLTGPGGLPHRPHQPADPGGGDRGEPDHGRHLLRRRAKPRCRLREPGRPGGGQCGQDLPDALTRTVARRGGSRRLIQLARRSSINLRSTSFMPPQIPWGSRILMA